MLITALMAGHDPEAKTIFDGMYDYFRDHGSAIDGDLMAWFQDENCDDDRGDNSATDGDLDIAYALLLADKQWGSCGRIDYRAEALSIIESIREHDVSPSAEWTLLGDWVPGSSERFRKSTRTSDHMTGHFTTFESATGHADWGTLVQGSYDVRQLRRAGAHPVKRQSADRPRARLHRGCRHRSDAGRQPARGRERRRLRLQ